MKFESLVLRHFNESSLDDINKKFEYFLPKCGIKGNQLKIYIHLIRTGPKTPSQLSRFLAIPRTEVYTLLKGLQEKEAIILKRKRPMLLMAAPFENTIDKKLEEEKNKIQDLENFLYSLKHPNEIHQTIIK